MNKLMLPGLALLLVGCSNPFAKDYAVPSDPHLLNGSYAGEASAVVGGQLQTWPVTLLARASYASASEYDVTGTLTLRGNTYNIAGKGGGYLVRFRPQAAIDQPRLSWAFDVVQNGQKVGSATGNQDLMGTTDQVGSLVFSAEPGTSILLKLHRTEGQ